MWNNSSCPTLANWTERSTYRVLYLLYKMRYLILYITEIYTLRPNVYIKMEHFLWAKNIEKIYIRCLLMAIEMPAWNEYGQPLNKKDIFFVILKIKKIILKNVFHLKSNRLKKRNFSFFFIERKNEMKTFQCSFP